MTQMHSSTNETQHQLSKERMGSGDIDKNAFLRLLTEQLRHQDPMKPQENFEFITQQAMFTQVESLQNLTKSMDAANALSQSSSLIGKEVTVRLDEPQPNPQDPNNPIEFITGMVQSASISNNQASVQVGDMNYPTSSIVKVQNPSAAY